MPAVDPHFMKITVYLYPNEAAALEGQEAGGSGFLVATPSRHPGHFYPHVVTNAHVIDSGCHFVRLNNKLSSETTILPTKPSDWTFAPDDDLAVMGTYFPPEANAVSLGLDMFIEDDCMVEGWPLLPGDDVYLYGRFIGHDGRQQNKPVMRFGNLSMLPDAASTIRIHDRDQIAFLVECRSLSGFSGSPAFVRLAQPRHPAPGAITPKGMIPVVSRFLGVDCGHFPFWSSVYQARSKYSPTHDAMHVETNSGISVVIPAWRLARLLDHESLLGQREDEERRLDKNAKSVTLSDQES